MGRTQLRLGRKLSAAVLSCRLAVKLLGTGVFTPGETRFLHFDEWMIFSLRFSYNRVVCRFAWPDCALFKNDEAAGCCYILLPKVVGRKLPVVNTRRHLLDGASPGLQARAVDKLLRQLIKLTTHVARS